MLFLTELEQFSGFIQAPYFHLLLTFLLKTGCSRSYLYCIQLTLAFN